MLAPKHIFPFLHFFFPHHCPGCGNDVIKEQDHLCWRCLRELPYTTFASLANNPVEKTFWGRISVRSATSLFYFSKHSIVQNIVHHLKYKNKQELGIFLGRMMGDSLLQTNRFNELDYLVPMPLHAKKEKMRGYNQSELLCRGIAEIIQVPLLSEGVIRELPTETQTKKHRMERWQNVEATFKVQNSALLEGKHVLLVDDVITTGATLEACGAEILKCKNTQLSLATLAVATQ